MNKVTLIIASFLSMSLWVYGQVPVIDLQSFTLNSTKINEITPSNYSKLQVGNFNLVESKNWKTASDSMAGITFYWEESSIVTVIFDLNKTSINLNGSTIKKACTISELKLPILFRKGAFWIDTTQKRLIFPFLHDQYSSRVISLESRLLTASEFAYFLDNSAFDQLYTNDVVTQKAFLIEVEKFKIIAAAPRIQVLNKD